MNLIDLMLAMMITAMGALAVSSLLISSESAGTRATDQVVAVNAARQEIEILRGINASELYNRTNAPFVGSVPQIQSLTDAHTYLTITDYAGAPGAKQITAKVTWTTRTARTTRSYSLATIAVPRGIGR